MDVHNLFILIFIQIVLVIGQKNGDAGKDVKTMTEKAYAKLFKERRQESKELLRIIRDETIYERKYRLLEGAYDKLLTILEETQNRLRASKYDPLVSKFPTQDTRLIDAITVTLENTCLFGEIILHNPDISDRILESRQNAPDWRDLINWCIKFTRQFNDRILDAKAQELLYLAEQEINPDKRTENFINPYRRSKADAENTDATKKKKKKAKKLPKGPQMVTRDEF